jgi:Ca-activated chloride channel homolog
MPRLNSHLFAGAAALALLSALARMSAAADTPQAQDAPQPHREYTIAVDVNMVVLHATVVDTKGRMINGLRKENFTVYENGVAQKLSVFSQADIPVTVGIVIDDSGSMREKRAAVNAAALTFVRTSNPQDQVFVVNFNDNYYLDTPGDFASNIEELKSALDKIDSRGGTAMRDAIHASLDHMKLANRDKKVLLVITDGEDNGSRYTLEEVVKYLQKGSTLLYSIGLLGENEPGGLFKVHGAGPKRARKVLEQLAEVSGGQAYFPKSLEEVESICVQIARDIRNQYTLAYYPTNAQKDGTFRAVRIEARPARGNERLTVRARPGYYAPKTAAEAAAPTGK